jgi:hypothetical protein
MKARLESSECGSFPLFSACANGYIKQLSCAHHQMTRNSFLLFDDSKTPGEVVRYSGADGCTDTPMSTTSWAAGALHTFRQDSTVIHSILHALVVSHSSVSFCGVQAQVLWRSPLLIRWHSKSVPQLLRIQVERGGAGSLAPCTLSYCRVTCCLLSGKWSSRSGSEPFPSCSAMFARMLDCSCNQFTECARVFRLAN